MLSMHEADRDPRRGHRRHDHRQPAAQACIREEAVEIIVVDRDDRHMYQPGLLFVPFGIAEPEDIVRSRSAQLHRRHRVPSGRGRSRRHRGRRRSARRRRRLEYDVLVVASGASAAARGDRGTDGGRLGRDASSPSTRPRARPASRRARSASRAAGSSSTWSTCRSNALSRRSSSASSPIGSCASSGVRDRTELDLRHPARRRVHEADRGRAPGRDLLERRASSW